MNSRNITSMICFISFCAFSTQAQFLIKPGIGCNSINIGDTFKNHANQHNVKNNPEFRYDTINKMNRLLNDTIDGTNFFYHQNNTDTTWDAFLQSILDSIEFTSKKWMVSDSKLSVGEIFDKCTKSAKCQKSCNSSLCIYSLPGITYFCDPATNAIAYIRVMMKPK